MSDSDETGSRRFLQTASSYPYIHKIHRNLYLILAIAASVKKVENLIKGSVPVYAHPSSSNAVNSFGAILQELLRETALLIRVHDEYWENKCAGGWSKILSKKCGIEKFSKKGKKTENPLGLRDACNKIIHHTGFDIGFDGGSEFYSVYLAGKNENKNGQQR
ncbi:MAG: hypothetical protein NPIRA04_33800 [Nitrospirales bacterium]|nr:MAG: hypothetical protein NPIRA04_33800 [Nitrospirales bacterium]